jgi:hypothetical protein
MPVQYDLTDIPNEDFESCQRGANQERYFTAYLTAGVRLGGNSSVYISCKERELVSLQLG